MKIETIKTLGELKKAGYQSKSIKDELRENLIENIKNKANTFDGIHGYENTVIPELERAILSRHNINLLGLRGQAKTRLARMMVNLLDEYIPVVEGSEINDDPLAPISRYALELVSEKGDDTPITWLHRDDRFPLDAGLHLLSPRVLPQQPADPVDDATQALLRRHDILLALPALRGASEKELEEIPPGGGRPMVAGHLPALHSGDLRRPRVAR